jgi:hypothetical protein
VETNPYHSDIPAPGANPHSGMAPVSLLASSLQFVRQIASVPCWIGSVFFTLVGLTAIVQAEYRTHVLFALASGGLTLSFLVLQLLQNRGFAFNATLATVGGLSILATASDHTFRETELASLGPDCGLPAMAHLVFSLFWFSTYVCVPCTVLIRLIGVGVHVGPE